MDLTTAYTDAWYRQPDPGEWPASHRPTNRQWVIVAAVWLLATWSRGQRPGWAFTLVPGRPNREGRERPEPSLREIADVCDLPAVTSATVLTGNTSADPEACSTTSVAAELVTLISDVVPVRDRRGEALVGFLADHLADPYSDVYRLTVGADERGAPSLPLHLLHRDTYGNTLRVSLCPAPEVRQPPVIASVDPDAALRARIAGVSTLLSDLLWVNNNNPVDFRFRIGRLDKVTGDPIADGTRWWAANREDADEYDAEEFRAVAAADVRAGLHNELRMSLIELFDGEWSGIEEFPEVPAGHVATFLLDDLLDLVLARMGDDVLIAIAGVLPVTWPPEDEDDDQLNTAALLVAGDEVAVLEVDLSC